MVSLQAAKLLAESVPKAEYLRNNASIISVPLSLQSFKLLAPRANRLP